MLLRAYAFTVGLRKDRKVLTMVAMTIRQINWGLEGEELSCGVPPWEGLGRSHGDLVAEVGEEREGVPRSPTGLRERSWCSQVGSAEELRAQVRSGKKFREGPGGIMERNAGSQKLSLEES